MDLTLWKYQEETQFVLKAIDIEIEITKNEILEFGGVMTSPYLEREYCRSMGYLAGLKAVKQLIEERNDENA